MRKFISICLVILVLFSLTGCNEEQKAALQVVIEQEVQDEGTYTPDSYQNYVSALENAKAIKEKSLASKNEIAEAQQDLQNAIDNLYVIGHKNPVLAGNIREHPHPHQRFRSLHREFHFLYRNRCWQASYTRSFWN